MSPLVFWLSIIGLAVSIMGSGILYKGTPVDNGEIRLRDGLTAAEIESAIKKEKGIKNRKILSQIGFALLFIGFVLQFISVFLQAP